MLTRCTPFRLVISRFHASKSPEGVADQKNASRPSKKNPPRQFRLPAGWALNPQLRTAPAEARQPTVLFNARPAAV